MQADINTCVQMYMTVCEKIHCRQLRAVVLPKKIFCFSRKNCFSQKGIYPCISRLAVPSPCLLPHLYVTIAEQTKMRKGNLIAIDHCRHVQFCSSILASYVRDPWVLCA